MTRKDFHHPFHPYDIQQQFMEALYQCIENGGVGIFESPTGTGKSLSLICGSLTWLREHKRQMYDEALASITVDDDEPAWMIEHARAARKVEMRQARADLEARLNRVREQEAKTKQRQMEESNPRKRQKRSHEQIEADDGEDQFLLDDYDSGDEGRKRSEPRHTYSKETQQLMEQIGLTRKNKPGEDDEQPQELKIFFCSRTHSQLSQLAGELRRVQLPPGMPSEDADSELQEPLKQLALGSRKNLCINRKVSSLGDQTAINERCIELQQFSTSVDRKCSFLLDKDNVHAATDFRDHALAKIRDIEDLATLGSRMQVCPYYASRGAVAPAEVITLPYPLLLQKSARQALGLSLKGHVVIIDEAHNILDAIEGIYSTQVSNTQLQNARQSLIVYLQKFRNRLKGSNRVYVTQVVRIIDSLLVFIDEVNKASKCQGGNVQAEQLLRGKGVDQINLTKLVAYISDSRLARKVEGYVSYHARLEARKPTGGVPDSSAPRTPTLTIVQNFLTTLMNPSKEGRFFWSRSGDDCIVRYMLLDPSEHFREVVEEARAVILAGGTMSPMSDYTLQLFPYLDHLTTFSCDHLIPPEHLFVRTLASDLHGRLDFSFRGRNSNAAGSQIGGVLSQIASVVSGGMVVFFPSYGFMEQTVKAWRSEGALARLETCKPLFFDERGSSVDDVFTRYKEANSVDHRGAMLFSVLGGKLSEGINFSDDLGRCVVVVGLPFPNLETPEWKAKMNYLDQKAATKGRTNGRAGAELAENVCMRSVNQAIGRVIRHKDDWASIVLMDHRYTQARIRGKLPAWIRKSLPDVHPASSSHTTALPGVVDDLDTFFQKRNRHQNT